MKEPDMSMTWGPAVDAEINYRRQQARRDFGRGIFHRKVRALRDSSPRNPINRAAI
jgi:hypothetical protein